MPEHEACTTSVQTRQRLKQEHTIVLHRRGAVLRLPASERDLVSVTEQLGHALADALLVDLRAAPRQRSWLRFKANLLTYVPLLERSVTFTAEALPLLPSHSILQ